MKPKKRSISLFIATAMIGVLVASVPVAQAQEPDDVELFQPDADFADGDKTVLADQPDGEDDRAHLTAVADDEADEAHFFRCEDPIDTLGEFDDDACTHIDSDHSPNQPDSDADHAFDVLWNVPTDDDDTNIFVFACEDDADVDDPDTGVPDDCVGDVTQDVTLDDSGGDVDYSTGEIIGWCDDDDDVCDENNDDFESLEHGDELDDDEDFRLLFSTSDDVDDAWGCLDFDADAQNDPDACDEGPIDAVAGEDDDEWNVVFSNSGLDEDDDVDVVIGCDADDCVGEFDQALILDEHYSHSGEDDGDGDGDGDGVDEDDEDDVELTFTERVGDDCDTPRSSETNEFDADTASTATLDGCVFQEDGDQTHLAEVTFELSGVGDITFCEGDLHDHDNDGEDEHCHVNSADGDPITRLAYDLTINNVEDGDPVEGRATIEFCVDPEATGTGAGTEANPGSQHGCADESSALTDTATKTYGEGIDEFDHLHLGFDPGAVTDPCHSGTSFRENVVGDVDTLLVCTLGEAEVPSSTMPVTAERHLQLLTSNASVVALLAPIPTETDATGRTSVQIQAVGPGTATITARLICEDTTEPDCPSSGVVTTASVVKHVVEAGPENIPANISIRYRRHRFRGVVDSVPPCVANRVVALKRARRGRDRVIRTDQTNGFGRYNIFKRRARGRYYAVVRQAFRTNANGDTVTCLRARSRTMFRF